MNRILLGLSLSIVSIGVMGCDENDTDYTTPSTSAIEDTTVTNANDGEHAAVEHADGEHADGEEKVAPDVMEKPE